MENKKLREIETVKFYYQVELKNATMILNLKISLNMIDNRKSIQDAYKEAFKRAIMRANLINEEHFSY